MTTERRLDARQIKAAVEAGKAAGALRIHIDAFKIDVVLSERVERDLEGFTFDHEQDHHEAA